MIEKELLVLRAMRGKLGPDPEGRLYKKPLEAVKKALDESFIAVEDKSKKGPIQTDLFCRVDAISENSCSIITAEKHERSKTCEADSFLSLLNYLSFCPIVTD